MPDLSELLDFGGVKRTDSRDRIIVTSFVPLSSVCQHETLKQTLGDLIDSKRDMCMAPDPLALTKECNVYLALVTGPRKGCAQ